MTNLNMSNFIRIVIMRGSAHSSEAMDLLREVDPVVNGMLSDVRLLMIIDDKFNHHDSEMMDHLMVSQREITYIQDVVYNYLYTGER